MSRAVMPKLFEPTLTIRDELDEEIEVELSVNGHVVASRLFPKDAAIDWFGEIQNWWQMELLRRC